MDLKRESWPLLGAEYPVHRTPTWTLTSNHLHQTGRSSNHGLRVCWLLERHSVQAGAAGRSVQHHEICRRQQTAESHSVVDGPGSGVRLRAYLEVMPA